MSNLDVIGSTGASGNSLYQGWNDYTVNYSHGRLITNASLWLVKDMALPVELNSFTASTDKNKVLLNWKTASEINSMLFVIERSFHNQDDWFKIGEVKASGNSNSTKYYSFSDELNFNGNYSYRLKMIDYDNSFKYSDIVNVEIGAPAVYELSNAYPNPFNPTTTISYNLPVEGPVSIRVYDALGNETSVLVNEVKPSGVYKIVVNSHNLSSGVYFYRMTAGNFTSTKKFILIK